MSALTKIPSWLQVYNKDIFWRIPQPDKVVYLTFDDGPHPIATPIVLNLLNNFNCKANFFCVGNMVEANSDIYQRILSEGHVVGNHSYTHLNGWKTNNAEYLADVMKASGTIQSGLFRPPYGRITPSQFKQLRSHFKVVMWDVLSKDYDPTVSTEQVVRNVMTNIQPGSIVVMHDNDKTAHRMETILSILLTELKSEGWSCKTL